MSEHLLIGDAVVPINEPDHDVMTVYDFDRSYALCNWVVGPKQTMHKVRVSVSQLQRVTRATDNR